MIKGLTNNWKLGSCSNLWNSMFCTLLELPIRGSFFIGLFQNRLRQDVYEKSIQCIWERENIWSHTPCTILALYLTLCFWLELLVLILISLNKLKTTKNISQHIKVLAFSSQRGNQSGNTLCSCFYHLNISTKHTIFQRKYFTGIISKL